MALSTALVFDEDLFEVRELNRDGKFFEKVTRAHCVSNNYETELVLDIATNIFPVKVGEKYLIALASTLNTDGSADTGVYDQTGKATLADKYDYVCSGKVFKITHATVSGVHKTSVYVSFGGLLMELKGEPRNLQSIEYDARIYLLMKKASK